MLNRHAKKSVQRSGRRGAIMVEMVIVLPVLCALIFGMCDLGLMLKDSLALSHMAKDAARDYAVGTSQTTIETRITDFATAAGMDLSDLTISPPSATSATDDTHVEVTLTYKHQTIAGGLWGGPATGIVTLKGTGIHLKE